MFDWLPFDLPFGATTYHYDSLFVVYLIVGWGIVLIHAQQNFRQPTYEFSKDQPASIIMPPFIVASRTLYLRGIATYLTSMTVLYIGLSLAGPTFVAPALKVYENPQAAIGELTSRTEARPATAETQNPSKHDADPIWPFAIALALVGLVPNLRGLKEPELILRRISHRIALIPAYIKFLTYQMQLSLFDTSAIDGKYTALGVSYRPNVESLEATDQAWRKICCIYRRVRQIAIGAVVPALDGPVDDETRESIIKELDLFGARLRELDAKLLEIGGQAAVGHDADERDKMVQGSLSQVYLLTACVLVTLRVRDISKELRDMGFSRPGGEIPNISALFFIIFFGLFAALLFLYILFGALSGNIASETMPGSFLGRVYAVAALVLPLGISTYVAVTSHKNLERSRAAGPGGRFAANLIRYFRITIRTFLSAALALYLVNMFSFTNTPRDLFGSPLVSFAIIKAVPLTASGMITCAWMNWLEARTPSLVAKGVATLLISACLFVLSAVATYLFFSGLEPMARPPDMEVQIAFYGGLFFIAGLVAGVLSEAVVSYGKMTRDSGPVLAQPSPAPATPG